MNMNRLELAELTGALGAGVLGAGLALLLPALIARYALPLLAVGLVLHGWGMYDKHRLEQGQPTPAWATALYGLCWGLLVVGGLIILHHLRMA
jgi:hypothetical protein